MHPILLIPNVCSIYATLLAMVVRHWPRCIIHADMDAFFAAIEQRDRPELRGKPVLVGGSAEGRGVVAAASYEARAYGCRSAMPMKRALRLCPQATVVRPHFALYREASGQVMAILRRVTLLIEPLSLDEAFLDITQWVASGADPERVARWIKARVREETGLTLSCGVAASKSIAKVASARAKPDGVTLVAVGAERAFLAPLAVRDLWGVGPKTAERLERAGVDSIGALAERPVAWLIDRFGVRGEWFHRLANGEDDRPLEVTHERKSISSETTFARDKSDRDELAEVVRRQAATVVRRLQHGRLRARTVQIKLRLSDFTTFTRRKTLPAATSDREALTSMALDLLGREVGRGRRFRLVGVGLSNLVAAETASQLGLFDPAPPSASMEEPLESAVAALRERYGEQSIGSGARPRREPR